MQSADLYTIGRRLTMKSQGLTQKIYLELNAPTEEDSVSYQLRILNALKEQGIAAHMSLGVLRSLYPLCDRADWKLTVSLAYANSWEIVKIEEGDRTADHYGVAVDLGSTSVAMQLLNCNTGEVLAQESSYNHQIAFGEDILTRIFYSKDDCGHLEEIRRATVDTFLEVMEKLEKNSGISKNELVSMVVAGNTTMIHFLIGMDAFCVFSSPYSVRADQPGFYRAKELDLPLDGYVYCYPGKANYLGGDIISGMIATEIHRKQDISLFFDVGTNGELVIGNKDFLLCGAGAAGPALEGGVVKTGMRAGEGAVERVRMLTEDPEQDICLQGQDKISQKGCCNSAVISEIPETLVEEQMDCEDDRCPFNYVSGPFYLGVIGGTEPKGICGSGIVDLLSELFINGWIDLRGKLVPERSDRIVWIEEEEQYAAEYAPGLFFYQQDIDEFLKTKAAAYTMMEYIMSEAGMTLDDVSDFYMAGAFGTHITKEAAINIGMYPDVDLGRIHTAGNSSLDGARMLLLDRRILDELDEILELMSYVQFGAVEDFVHKMVAASALPHTDLERYPTVAARLEENKKWRI